MTDITIRSEASMDYFTEALIKNGFDVERKLIPVDGVIWTDDEPIAFDRKSTSDYIRSLKDGSLWDQLKAMREFTSRENCYILLEDYDWPFSLKHTFFNRHSIVSANHSVLKFGNLLPTLSKTHTFEWLQDRLEETLRKYKETKSYTLRPSAKKDKSPAEKAQYVMEGFTGVGGTMSAKIRKNSDSLWGFLQSVNYKTDSVNYIPRKLVDEIKAISMANWKQ